MLVYTKNNLQQYNLFEFYTTALIEKLFHMNHTGHPVFVAEQYDEVDSSNEKSELRIMVIKSNIATSGAFEKSLFIQQKVYF